MAEKKVSNERRKELEQLDPFQQNLIKVIRYTKTYKKQLGMLVGGLVLIVVVFSGIMYSFEKSENEASTRLSQALTAYAQNEDPVKGYDQVKDEFGEIFKDYANTAAGRIARVEFGKICFKAGKYDQSIEQYEEALALFSNKAAMENFILTALGQVCLAKNDSDGAKQYFDRVKKSKSGLLKSEALFALAMLAEKAGDPAQSRTFYETITESHASSIYAPIAHSKIKKIE